jgi:hypothetical protein
MASALPPSIVLAIIDKPGISDDMKVYMKNLVADRDREQFENLNPFLILARIKESNKS